jgi:hypothetical protein
MSRRQGLWGDEIMTCAEFQKVLPYIMESGGNPEQEEHLRSCPVCSDLVADLKHIAGQARMLLPLEEPHPRVWLGIREALEQERLIRPPQARLWHFVMWRPAPWLAAAAAMVLLTFSIFLYQRGDQARTMQVAATPPAKTLASIGFAEFIDSDDQQLLSVVSEYVPSMRTTYEKNLQRVNSSIFDARKSVEQNPDDADAREYLIQAYQQKAMLYDMAMRSVN